MMSRVHGADVVDFDPQAAPRVGQEVREEDVAAPRTSVVEHVAAAGRLEREADAALPPVGVLHQRLERPGGRAAGAERAARAGRRR